MIDWRMKKVNDGTIQQGMVDGFLVDALNRFAREAQAVIDDPDNTVAGDYQVYEPIEFEYRIPSLNTGWTKRFGGYVADTTTEDDQTVIDCLSYDALLRGKTVSRGYPNVTISNVLEDLIKGDEITAVQWDSGSQVTVENDVTIDREFKGETLPQVLDELAVIAAPGSASAEWGADDQNRFYFRPRGSSEATRDFVPGSHWNLEVEERGREWISAARIYYGKDSNRDAVVVKRGAEADDAANRLGVGELNEELSKYYPQISTADAAKRKARTLLQKNSELTVYNFDTYEGVRLYPGDVGVLRNNERGINTNIRVVELEHDFSTGDSKFVCAERSETSVDVLVRLSDEVSRLDARGQDSTAIADQLESLSNDVRIKFLMKITKTNYELADPYDAPAGDNLELQLEPYTAPNGDNLEFEFQSTDVELGTEILRDDFNDNN